MAFLESRRRNMARKGRPMLLRRQTTTDSSGNLDVSVSGYKSSFTPTADTNDIQQGNAMMSILNDEIVAAAWPGPPMVGDVVIIDGAQWGVIGSEALYEGVVCIGHVLSIHGGRS